MREMILSPLELFFGLKITSKASFRRLFSSWAPFFWLVIRGHGEKLRLNRPNLTSNSGQEWHSEEIELYSQKVLTGKASTDQKLRSVGSSSFLILQKFDWWQ
jgi:hypothetical protein